jgi:acetyl esterase/lipase
VRALGLLMALPAGLIPFRDPSYALWWVRIALTEWGHLFGLIQLAVLLLRPWRRLLGRILTGLHLLSAGLLLSPLLRAIPIACRLPATLESAFGPMRWQGPPGYAPRERPLVARELLLGVSLRRRTPERAVYQKTAELELTLDLYRPYDTAVAPLVIVIHGGSWEGGSCEQLSDLNHYLAARGYVVAALNYRLAPRYPFPAAYDDICAAITFLQSSAERYGIDPTRIALLGRSAGGHLALLTAYCTMNPAIKAVISLYGPADLRFAYEHPSNPRVIDTRGVIARFLGGTPLTARAQYDAASPICFVGQGTPPTLLIHGGTDELVQLVQSKRLAIRLAEVQRPHYLLELPWATHACDANLAGPSGQLSLYAIEYLLGRYLITDAGR